ncbi:AF4/FMR2 family member 1 isoform X2 [Sceloporus undulatus]|uniref:AF4/FMR2 family member 1 isoform X2 n=1 Tax=Sceloporus undulatus TaxID=8520 RepID=UPI001C4D28AE|nr:AF4/FMR2 family member 1 isoform X2 [Sceloporus undulatus]
MAAQSSLYNEERNLLRIQAKERRNQEAHQERETFPAAIPLFEKPYKINKADELSSRIQKMFGDYEEMKELIAARSQQNYIGIPESVMSLIPPHKPDRPLFPGKTSSTLPPSFQNNYHHKPLGPLPSSAPSAGNSVHYQKAHSRIDSVSQSSGMSSHQRQSQELSCKTQEVQSSRRQQKSEKCIEEDIAREVQASLLELSPLLSTLSSPIAPLSPLHSGQRINSRPQSSSNNKKPGQNSSPPQELVAGTCDKETQDSVSAPVAVAAQPSTQTFPSSLSSKTSAIQQKPTAYVRPMDGQDQAPDESPELKPLPKEYHESSYGKITSLKANTKTNLPKLKIPAEPVEQSFSNEVHCVEEILKEMTHSWPPPLTAIHTPSTAEPSKFPFPAKETQHGGSDIQSQKQYDAPSKTLSASQQGTSTLLEDLQLSDSEDGDDDQVSDKPSSASTPPSVPPSQPESVALAHSSSPESGSTSDSDSSSDSESESSSSDSEANDPPTRASTPEPDPQASTRWQLKNWLRPNESVLEDDHSRGSLQEGKGQEKTFSSGSCNSSKRECPPPADSHSKTGSKAPIPGPEVHLPTKRSYQKPPVHTEEPFHQTVGSKQPRKSIKATVPEEPKRGLTVESEPPGPYGAKDQSSKDKPKVKTKGKLKSGEKKELRPTAPQPLEKKKHKNLNPTTVQSFSDRNTAKDNVVGSALEQLPLSPLNETPRVPVSSRSSSSTKGSVVVREDIHRDKFLLPVRDKKLLSPLRDCPVPSALVVKIELALLSRIPQPPGKMACPKRPEGRDSHSMNKQDADKRSVDMPSKCLKRRKEDALKNDQKKAKLDKETKSSSSSGHKDSSKTKISKPSVETQRKEMPLPPLPLSSPMQPVQKPAKIAQKRPKGESGACSQPSEPILSTAKSKESHKDLSSSKHRRLEGKPSESSKSNKGSAEDVPNPFPVPSLPNGTSKPTKPQSKPHKLNPVEFYIKEAKRLKHKADAMTDKVGKAFKYLDAALCFIESGIAMESDPFSPKPAYSMFAETIELIKFIMAFKSFADPSTTTPEKIFIVFCMRCQAILYMAMFRYKKDTAIKYSRTLNEHFKSSSKITQAPSPCVARSTGTPSPLSPTPSPAGSVSSQTGSSASSCGSGGIGASINVPHYIPTITSSFVNITSYILYAYDLWEQADVLARRNKKFFSELNAAACNLSLNSSMIELVHYTRQGLQWLRLEPNTP